MPRPAESHARRFLVLLLLVLPSACLFGRDTEESILEPTGDLSLLTLRARVEPNVATRTLQRHSRPFRLWRRAEALTPPHPSRWKSSPTESRPRLRSPSVSS